MKIEKNKIYTVIFVVFVLLENSIMRCCYVIYISQSFLLIVAFNIKHRNNIPNTLSSLETIETILIDVCRKFSVRTLLQNAEKVSDWRSLCTLGRWVAKRNEDNRFSSKYALYFLFHHEWRDQFAKKVAEFIFAMQYTVLVVQFL